MQKGTTFTHYLIEDQRNRLGATGEFTSLLAEIATAGKIIAHEVRLAGLGDIIGHAGIVNVQGEDVQKLDVLANDMLVHLANHTGHLAAMVSEEIQEILYVPPSKPKGKYLLLFDPLDGSSNIDVNVSVGTIFGILPKLSPGADPCEEDFFQTGNGLVCAGYILYGSSTMLVYTSGNGVHGFTFDPSTGEFCLSHENMTIPKKGNVYSVNDGNYYLWDDAVRRYVDELRGKNGHTGYSARYIGSLVADFHRNLLKGGIFLYPADAKNPNGKLRLLYEANPLSFIVEQAGGRASDGVTRILDIHPTSIHQRTPLFIGSEEDVRMAESYINGTEAA